MEDESPIDASEQFKVPAFNMDGSLMNARQDVVGIDDERRDLASANEIVLIAGHARQNLRLRSFRWRSLTARSSFAAPRPSSFSLTP